MGLVRGRGAWLANFAALFAILGLSTLPGLVVIDFYDVAVANVTDLDTSAKVQDEVERFVPLLLPAMLSVALSIPFAVAALCRAGLAPWWLLGVVFAGFVGMALTEGVMTFAVAAVVLAAISWALWRIPKAAWYRGDGPVDGVAPAEAAA